MMATDSKRGPVEGPVNRPLPWECQLGAEFDAARWAALKSGKVRASSVRRIDFDPARRVFTSRVSRRGGPWSEARSVAQAPRATIPLAVRPGASAPRPRERRDGSRRHSTRGGTDSGDSDGSEPEPPGDGVAGRLCAVCGCDISHRRAGALTCGIACRRRLSRAQAASVPLKAGGSGGWSLDPSLAEVLADRLDMNDPLVSVLIRCGDWPVAA